MSTVLHYAIWLYDEEHSTTRAFWKVSCAVEQCEHLAAMIQGTNACIALQRCELHLQAWEEARKTTAREIRDNNLHEFYPGARRGDDVSDATMIDYWNYQNDDVANMAFGEVPRGGAVTLGELIERLAVYRPRPVLRVVP